MAAKQSEPTVDVVRRRLLGIAAAGAALLIAPSVEAVTKRREPPRLTKKRRDIRPDRALSFYNTHTSESLRITYWTGGRYVPDALKEVRYLLRDHYNDRQHHIDPQLLDLLYGLRTKVGANKPIHVVSGYRSPETNAILRLNSDGVATKSLHMEGKAIDIRVPGVRLSQLRRAALTLRRGGVGYYPSSDFLHMDTGPLRIW